MRPAGHLRHILTECVTHYNQERPHQSVGIAPLSGAGPPRSTTVIRLADVRCGERLGGLRRHYHRRALRIDPTRNSTSIFRGKSPLREPVRPLPPIRHPIVGDETRS